MRATQQDIPQLARLWYAEKEKTCFGGLEIEWSVLLCALHLEKVLHQENTYLAVEKQGKQIVAACGSTLVHTLVPPHPLVVMEWMWYGVDKRAVTRVFHECLAWGKQCGALMAQYVLNQRQSNNRKWIETYQWRVL